MAEASTRRALAERRRRDRDRKRAQRQREADARTPDQRAVEQALAVAVRRVISRRYQGIRNVPPDSELHDVVKSAVEVLVEGGFDTGTKLARSRLKACLSERG